MLFHYYENYLLSIFIFLNFSITILILKIKLFCYLINYFHLQIPSLYHLLPQDLVIKLNLIIFIEIESFIDFILLNVQKKLKFFCLFIKYFILALLQTYLDFLIRVLFVQNSFKMNP